MKQQLISKLPFKEKIGYALGDTAANIAWRPLMSFLPIFYTDVFGLPIITVSLLLLITRLSDGVTDIIMGTIADRTQSRWGKFRPWLLWTSLPFGIFLALTFTTPNLSLTGKIIWAYFTYISFTLIYTANNVPYSALMGVMTGNLKERNSLSSFRFFGAYFGGVISMALIPVLVEYLGNGNDNQGYQYTMYILAVLMIIFTLITFSTTKERVYPHHSERQNIIKDFKDLLKNKAWAILLLTGFLFVTYNSIKQGVTMYYFSYYLHEKIMGGAYLTVLVIVSMLATLIAPPLINTIGKKKLFIYVMMFSALVNALLYFAGPEDIVMVFIIGSVSELGAAIMPVLFFSMLADSADYSEWKNNRRATGLIFSAGTFAMKFGGGLAGAVMLFVMNMYGYDGAAEIKSVESIQGIILNMSLIPGLFLALAILIMLFYPLSKQKIVQIENDLKERRERNLSHL